MKTGAGNLITDVDGILVGNAEDHELKSGCTVIAGDEPFVCAVHVMGGAPGTRETDLLAPEQMVGAVDAVILSGGSAFGLDAASGVVEGLRARGRGFQVGPAIVPIVPGAILFDLANGGEKDWDINPYPALGRAALDAAETKFSLGTAGAGTGATTANLKGGLGSASLVLENGITVGAIVAVNALGGATPEGQPQFWASPWEIGAEFGGQGSVIACDPCENLAVSKLSGVTAGSNTTLAVVATDARLTKSEAKRLATAAHDGMARALVPSHTPYDGDLVFAISTGKREMTDPMLDPVRLGHAAATCLSRAIARGVYLATEADNDTLPTWRAKWS